MAKRGRYKTSATGKIVGIALTALCIWAAWEFGLLNAIADLSTVPVSAERSR